jgi:hypothetical protein
MGAVPVGVDGPMPLQEVTSKAARRILNKDGIELWAKVWRSFIMASNFLSVRST